MGSQREPCMKNGSTASRWLSVFHTGTPLTPILNYALKTRHSDCYIKNLQDGCRFPRANFELCSENPAFGLQIVLQNDPGAAFAAVAGFGVAAGTKALIDFDELADGFPKDRAGSLCMYAFSVNNHNFL